MSQRKKKPYARKDSRTRCHFASLDGRQCTEPRSHFCVHHSSMKNCQEENRPKVTVADIFGRYRRLSHTVVIRILTQSFVEFANGRITHNEAGAITRLAYAMLRSLKLGEVVTDLPLDVWRAEAADILATRKSA